MISKKVLCALGILHTCGGEQACSKPGVQEIVSEGLIYVLTAAKYDLKQAANIIATSLL
jgi:hypothetical protein